ncbi:O-antigen ligase family protein [Alkalihalobacillus macyae]|uniref:O-antigen ligase family protein n=1 Tax=Guptibacillus hwajinpoensis TaxID=208199 RepID=UPI00273AB75C|nr:O-antigen ligase family protein [Alkalihalobacillus macyae]MDP4552607.1 O-antigen ligase family protein [Alkalihalobacillus macyae]
MDFNNRTQKKQYLLIIMFFLVTLTNFNLYIGFSVKPFMIFLLIYFLFHLSTFQIKKLYWYELFLVLFYLFYCYTGAFSKYPASSMRILLGFTILMICYFIMKFAMEGVARSVIEKSLAIAGILFNLTSLGLYVLGLISLGFQFQGDRIRSFGVMLDRDYPRLIGSVPDPNFYIFYNTLFFTYFLCNRKGSFNKIGLLLCILTNFLTFSRGGLLAMFLIVGLYFLMNNPLAQLKLLFGFVTSVTLIGYILIYYLKFDVLSIIQSRISDFSNDGGSGRFVLWERAWDYFTSHSLLGIGAFNFPNYNEFYHGENIQVHNMFLDILSESGIIGFLLFVTFILTLGVQLFRYPMLKKSPYLSLALIAIVFQMMSLSLIINEMIFMYLAVVSVMLSLNKASSSSHILKPINIQLSYGFLKGREGS